MCPKRNRKIMERDGEMVENREMVGNIEVVVCI